MCANLGQILVSNFRATLTGLIEFEFWMTWDIQLKNSKTFVITELDLCPEILWGT
jgi:hypothetical protein